MIFKIDTLVDFKEKVDTLKLAVTTVKTSNVFLGLATNGHLTFSIDLPNNNALNLFNEAFINTTNEVLQKTVVEPFALKGKNHFRGTGIREVVEGESTKRISFNVPYNTCCYNGIEILNGDYGDTVQLEILDNADGSFSAVPNAVLDQFGINWNMKKELVQILPYEATLYKSMVLCVEYTNNTTDAKTIYVNHYLHEVA